MNVDLWFSTFIRQTFYKTRRSLATRVFWYFSDAILLNNNLLTINNVYAFGQSIQGIGCRLMFAETAQRATVKRHYCCRTKAGIIYSYASNGGVIILCHILKK